MATDNVRPGDPPDPTRSAGNEAGGPEVGWDEVTRRYHRRPGGWWWLALLLVPLLVALLGLGLGGDDSDESSGPVPTGTTDTGATDADATGAAAATSEEPTTRDSDEASATTDGDVATATTDEGSATDEGCATLETESARLFDGRSISFESGDVLLGDASTGLIGELATLIKGCQGAMVEVGGHTDDTGSDVFNDELALARAQAVAEALVDQGVPEDRLRVVSYGAEEPVGSNDTEQGREANRRVEITIVEGER